MKEKPRKTQKLERYYRRLLKAYGPQHWWPADSRFEIMIGAILTQNTAWNNVERAVANLKREGLMTSGALDRVSLSRLAKMIRPSGYFRVKAGRIKAFVRFLIQQYGGDLKRMMSEPASILRSKLLSVKGIGPETADSILLYAMEVPVFVIDTYTRRVLSRHRMTPSKVSYDSLQRYFMDRLQPRPDLYNEFHALLVKVGKEHCKPTPACQGCPLKVYLNGKQPKIW
jgi:endonuclease-3 related protein